VVAIAYYPRDGGCFAGSYAVVDGVSQVIPVDPHVPGCPTSPLDLLKGLLALLIKSTNERSSRDNVEP